MSLISVAVRKVGPTSHLEAGTDVHKTHCQSQVDLNRIRPPPQGKSMMEANKKNRVLLFSLSDSEVCGAQCRKSLLGLCLTDRSRGVCDVKS